MNLTAFLIGGALSSPLIGQEAFQEDGFDDCKLLYLVFKEQLT